ncbi:MAG: hypothetical protein KDC18_18685, partial [Alphaproteobacteria bacterium]|nr:hypothetical protein [Alphaproteobacteria bacterium]
MWGAVALAAALVLSVLALEGLTLVGAVAAEPAPLLLLDPRAAAALAPDTLGRVIAADAVESPGVALANGSADGGCAGWTLLRAPGATTPVRLAAPVAGRFSPDAALRAVGRLPQIPAHVVLVAAGPPQCVSVACSVSRQLAARKPGLRIDVLALPPAGDRLRCVAGNSGGAFRSLEADGLAPALTGLFAAKGVAVAAAPPPPATAGPEPATVIPDAAPAKEAETRPGSVPVPRPAPRRSASVAKEPAAGTALASAPAVDTPAADTPVADETTAGATLRALPWVGPTAEDLPGAPEPEAWPQSSPPSVRLQAVPALGDVPLASELSYEVKAIGPDGVVRLVGRSWAAQPIFALPAGDYVARVTYRGVSREYRFHTKGQGLEHRSLPLDIGYAALRTVATAGAPPLLSNLEYTVRLPGGAPV